MKKFDFTVKSKIKNYDVIFDTLESTIDINEGDCVIIDSNVEVGINHSNIIRVDTHELSKEYSNVLEIINKIVDNDFKVNNKVIAIGGGIVQDIVGFISSILYRGVDWVYYPTTVLSQGGSCIGSKTSINLGKYKNVLGNFYPPTKVIIDDRFLTDLPDKQKICGVAGIVHYFLLDSRESFDYINRTFDDFDNLDETIYRSLYIKKRIIEVDEFDIDERESLSYGLIFGHAIETISNYEIPHGIAVSYGMSISNYVSYRLGYLSHKDYIEMEELLSKIYGYIELPIFDIDEYMNILKRDKKNIGDNLGLILTNGIGDMFLEQIPPEEIKDFIEFKLGRLRDLPN